jgi:hypothetical protein
MKQKKLINTFWECNVTTNFWFSVMDFLKNIDGSNVNLTSKGIILGNEQFESNLPVRSELQFIYYYDQLSHLTCLTGSIPDHRWFLMQISKQHLGHLFVVWHN